MKENFKFKSWQWFICDTMHWTLLTGEIAELNDKQDFINHCLVKAITLVQGRITNVNGLEHSSYALGQGTKEFKAMQDKLIAEYKKAESILSDWLSGIKRPRGYTKLVNYYYK